MPSGTDDAVEDRMALLETLRRFKPSQVLSLSLSAIKIDYMAMQSTTSPLLSNDDNDDPSPHVPPSFRQFKAASKKELEGYLNALGVPFSEGTLKAALISALQEALKE